MPLPKMALLATAASVLMLGGAGTADAVLISGTSDLWLAGMPDGSTASSGDTAPGESPVLIPGLALAGGTILNFAATGSVSNTPTPSGLSPDGGLFTSHSAGALNGIATLTAPFNSLIGVFLDAAQPNLSPPPDGLNFAALGIDFGSLAPALKQPFFIGDGLTGTGTGATQDFIVPEAATRLFLGTMDAFGWFNNSGSFDVTVSIRDGTPTPTPTPVPEPGTLALFTGALAALALLYRHGLPKGT
ncbi:PEP-CTERM sorting domain-containing protein [Roseomonas marmotae]|uniref:PEP-CTERM sorting domain-containing protein n=1 Tax=Roseomonas marmotae TaxID=2768161 RepID=A0ABS3KDX6_9PROT|nr:PEP-CTERM sorting domain-containing protein [Roseomonas marmotae]MBO1074853.1 PEP-CTERM sorting domain-containing protein [Roseomonas marmotae]QTI80642.1 PEP-CTERM sorting domain-containing protein [Roseomonas marmotae]